MNIIDFGQGLRMPATPATLGQVRRRMRSALVQLQTAAAGATSDHEARQIAKGLLAVREAHGIAKAAVEAELVTLRQVLNLTRGLTTPAGMRDPLHPVAQSVIRFMDCRAALSTDSAKAAANTQLASVGDRLQALVKDFEDAIAADETAMEGGLKHFETKTVGNIRLALEPFRLRRRANRGEDLVEVFTETVAAVAQGEAA